MRDFKVVPDGTRVVTGTVLAVNPVWLDAFSFVWQAVLSTGGAIIILLTIYKLVLEIKIRRNSLKD